MKTLEKIVLIIYIFWVCIALVWLTVSAVILLLWGARELFRVVKPAVKKLIVLVRNVVAAVRAKVKKWRGEPDPRQTHSFIRDFYAKSAVFDTSGAVPVEREFRALMP